ncbi:MAG: hypothetical protein HQL64_06225 [Magnetococcales bacterium]|nr:hypothetical protein [Magnetococcales bacterium]
MRQLTGALALLIVGVTVSPASASSWYGGDFSAEITMSGKDNPANQATGRIFVGKNRVRAEGAYRGQEKTVLIDAANHKAWTLLPQSKQYYEGVLDAPVPPEPDVKPLPSDPDSPCNANASANQIKCTKIGADTANGIPIEKWVVSRSVQGRTVQVNLWVDPQRHIIIRQEVQDGPLMERIYKGMDDISGRPTEKWEFTESFRGQSITNTQWIDARLRIPVRGVSGDQKYLLELRNIKEGPQADALFQLPPDYQQVAPPKLPQQGSRAPGEGGPGPQGGPPVSQPPGGDRYPPPR